MEAAETIDGFVAGAKVEVIGVAEDNARGSFFSDLRGGQALDRGLGADGHEDGGFDDAVGRLEEPGSRTCDGAGGLDFEAKGSGGQLCSLAGMTNVVLPTNGDPPKLDQATFKAGAVAGSLGGPPLLKGEC